MGVVKASYTKSAAGGAKSSKSAVKYAEHRKDAEGERGRRELYDQDGPVTRQEAYERIDRAEEQGGKYHYRLILNQGEGRGAADMERVTRDTMQALSERHGGRVEWVAVTHDDHSQHQHAHVIAVTHKTLSKDDLAVMRGELDRSHERHSYRDNLDKDQDAERDKAAERNQQGGGWER